MSIAFTLWTPPPKDPNGLVDDEDRRKIAFNVLSWYPRIPLSGAKLIVREIHRKYSVRRTRDIPRTRLRSVLCSTARWQHDVWNACEYGKLRGIVQEADIRHLLPRAVCAPADIGAFNRQLTNFIIHENHRAREKGEGYENFRTLQERFILEEWPAKRSSRPITRSVSKGDVVSRPHLRLVYSRG